MPLSVAPVLSPRQAAILAAATELFSRKGYASASMRDLADELAIRPASLYSHYRSKEDMLWAIAQRCADDFFAAVEPVAASAAHSAARLQAMLEAHVAVVLRHRQAAAIFFREWKHLDEPRRAIYARRIAGYEGLFAKVLEEGLETGDFRPLSPRLTTRTLLAALNWVHRWQPGPDEPDPQALPATLATLLMPGLRP